MAVTVTVCTAVPVAGGLVQSRHPRSSKLSQTKAERTCPLGESELASADVRVFLG